MSHEDFIVRDKIGDGGTLVLVTPKGWDKRYVKVFLDNPDWEIYDFDYWASKNLITEKTETISTDDWLDKHSTKK